MTSEFTDPSPTWTKYPNSDATAHTTSVAGTHVGEVSGTASPSARELSRTPRHFFTTKYSATMIPAMGGNTTPRTMRNPVS